MEEFLEYNVLEMSASHASLEMRQPYIAPPRWASLEITIPEDKTAALKMHSLILINQELNEQHVYTDGNGINEKVGSAAVIPATGAKMKKFLGSILEFTALLAELNAIYDALVWTEKNKTEISKVVIFTDSQASARALSNPNQSQNMQYVMKKIIRHADRLRGGGIKVHFVWIPAHMGIEGNDMADKAAKRSHRLEEGKKPTWKIEREGHSVHLRKP